MNRPIPTEIATGWVGGVEHRRRKPVSTRMRMRGCLRARPGPSHRPRSSGGDGQGNEGVETQTGGQGERVVGDHAHEDRRRPATRAVPAAMADRLDPSPDPPPRKSPLTSFAKPRIRVGDDDVRHREEGDDATADLPADARPLSVILKKRSTPLDGCRVDGRSTAVWDMAQRIVAGQADFHGRPRNCRRPASRTCQRHD